jgi:hypothetical protein
MTNLIIRTEDIKPEHILELYVESTQDRKTVDFLKSANPVVLEGSRGTGKSFLLSVAEAQLAASFNLEHVLPVYVSFVRSSLLQSGDPNQFLNWMMSRLCSRIVRALYQRGLLVKQDSTLALLSGGQMPLDFGETRLEKVAQEYEDSYKRPGMVIDSSVVPSVDDFKDAVEDTVGKTLQASEAQFQRISYVGPKRSRKMMNVVVSSVLEYLSG